MSNYWNHIWAILGPCLGYIRAMFWLFLQYLCFQMPQMAKKITGESGKPKRKYSSMFTFRIIFGPCLDHIRAMFWLFLQYICFQMPKMAQIFTEESCMPSRRIPFNVKILGLYKGHVWAILGPCFDYFSVILACRCLKGLKFSLKSYACQIEE